MGGEEVSDNILMNETQAPLMSVKTGPQPATSGRALFGVAPMRIHRNAIPNPLAVSVRHEGIGQVQLGAA